MAAEHGDGDQPGHADRDRRHRCQPPDPGHRLGVGTDPVLLRDRPARRAGDQRLHRPDLRHAHRVGQQHVTVTVKDGTGATGTASFAWNISGGGGGGGTCHVTYTKNSEWPGGFTAQVAIANTGTTTINGWSLTFTFPGDQKITSNFNGGFSQTGENATLTNASYNGTIAPGASITDGFQGTWTSNDANPTSFSVNGTACN